MSMREIEQLTERLAEKRGELQQLVMDTQAAMEAAMRASLPALRRLVASVATLQDKVKEAVQAEPELFEKPRTQTFAGIRVGFRKLTGKMEIEDEELVVRLIEKHFADQADVLIKTTKKPVKEALAQLSAAELKKLAIEVSDTGDVVMVKPVDGAAEKILKALLKGAEEQIEERKAA